MERGIGRASAALVALFLVFAPPAPADVGVQPGFPVDAWSGSGAYGGGPSLAITVGNIDRDPEPEILASGMATGPLYAWNGDGTRVEGWPTRDTGGTVYPVLAELSDRSPAFEVFGSARSGGIGDRLVAWDGDGRRLPGWPRRVENYVSAGAMAADLDGDGLDEIYGNENTSQILGYQPDGRPHWESPQVANQQQATPAAADLDGDGDLEIVSTSYTEVSAHHHDGTPVAGFPVIVSGYDSFPKTYLSIGDVDGDGAPEIVISVHRFANWVRTGYVVVIGADGTIERAIETPAAGYGNAPALADLTGDGTPEIVVQGESSLTAVRGDGTTLPGFPVAWENHDNSHAAPVVGDVDGDQRPDIVVTSHISGFAGGGQVRAFRADGTLLPGFPLDTPIAIGDLCPAIADVDGDGRNEILVAGFGDNITSHAPFLWAYDLGGGPHGRVEWGQFGGGPQHQGRYGAPTGPPAPPAPVGTPAGARLVADLRAGAASGDPGEAVVLGDTALFAAGGAGSGRELWASDGTPAGTRLVRDIRPGADSSSPGALVRAGDLVYFTADDGTTGRELWRTDGTAAGTQRVADIWPGVRGSRPLHMAAIGDEVWFAAWDGFHGYEPWRSDGTAAGTRLVADLIDGGGPDFGRGTGSDPADFTAYDGAVYFRAFNDETWSVGLIRSDEQGTSVVKGIDGGPDPWDPGDIVAGDGLLFLHTGDDVGRSDGTAAGTRFTPWELDYLVTDLVALGDWAIFGARGSRWLRMPYRLGATGDPVELVGGGSGGGNAEAPTGLLRFGDRIAFTAGGAATGPEPWVTAGRPPGVISLGDVRPGPRGSSPAMLAALGQDAVLFSADDGASGHELWTTDGTRTGTRRLTDLAPGPRSANIWWAVPVGDGVLMSADDGVHGQELWALDASPVPAPEPASTGDADTPAPVATVSPDRAQPAGTSASAGGTLASLRLSHTRARRGTPLVLTLRASGSTVVSVTLARGGRRLGRPRSVRLDGTGPRTLRVQTRGLRPGRYVVRAQAGTTKLSARFRVGRR